MKAFVYRGPGRKALEDRPKPELQAPGDAIVKMVKTTICGTDLHILKGDVATCMPGRMLGHEGVGVVDSVGAAVTAFKPGDRVLTSCISACGRCEYCRRFDQAFAGMAESARAKSVRIVAQRERRQPPSVGSPGV
jgi:alcohol dehydrogenase